jgi:hypothetical protein
VHHRFDGGLRSRQHANSWKLLGEPVRIAIEPQGRGHGCKTDFIGAQSSLHGIAIDLRDQVFAPNDEPDLWRRSLS